MQPLNNARHRAWRAVISALAGGGLTAAGLGGPLSPALGATAPVNTATSTDVSTTPASSGSEATTPEGGASTSTTPASTTTTPMTIAVPPPSHKAPASKPPASKAPAGKPPITIPLPATPPPALTEAPSVKHQSSQQNTASKQANPTQTTTGKKGTSTQAKSNAGSAANNVAIPPQLAADQAAALAAVLASSAASVQALGFYRIPLFLLPIYKAAAVQYGVPWEILAAINEIETDYGSDLSVSTAGAVGWMQFMPETWLQYGVDALDAGYADPYNPVDAVFAAARYLRAAGAATNLPAAILAYNHSEEYVSSVLLRAKLISSYPQGVIATLTGLTDGRLPVTGSGVEWAAQLSSASSATGNASAVPAGAASSASAAPPAPSSAPSALDSGALGSSPSLSPTAAAAKATPPPVFQLAELTSSPDAEVVAVQDGRVVGLGQSQRLGKYIVLRDVYGDLFTYAGLGSFAPTYALPKPAHPPVASPVVEAASTRAPTPSLPASAGSQPPVTLKVKTPAPTIASQVGQVSNEGEGESGSAGAKVRLFARPGNPDAVAAAASARRARPSSAGDRLPLRRGSVVPTGTVLGHVSVPVGAKDGHMRFAIRPAGDSSTIDPRPILANWAQLEAALHPQGAKAENALLGATASDVLLMSKAQLERTVLSDPGITIGACGRQEIASGKIDKRVLAVLAFLSRSGLKPTVSELRCAQVAPVAPGAADAVDVSAINGVEIAGHQGAGTITDLTIRTLLSLPGEFLPHTLTSLMRYPNAPSTHAVPAFWNRIRIAFEPAGPAVAVTPATAAHSARTGQTAPSPLLTPTYVSPSQWEQLMTRIASLPEPTVATKPSSYAIPDPKRR